MPSEALAMWTIYNHPTDFPDDFVARKFLIQSGGPIVTAEIMTSKDLDKLRRMMVDLGLTCLNRDPADAPVVVETWI